jgi:two-component system, OmpR family, alkaline phosphatase synthesis response regulator PhoP
MKKRVLVVEDEPSLSMAIRDELEFEGFEASVIEDGVVALERILTESPDLVVLDLMLPGRSGFDICREVRQQGRTTPIIMLTARAQEADKVRGLELGADDYVVKPFSLAELTARIRAVLRRTEARDPLAAAERALSVGALRLDARKQEVFVGTRKIELTRKEFQLLEFLLRHPGEVISRDEFLDRVWGGEVYVTPRSVDTHMAALRRKIERDADHPRYILSVRGAGYKLDENPVES